MQTPPPIGDVDDFDLNDMTGNDDEAEAVEEVEPEPTEPTTLVGTQLSATFMILMQLVEEVQEEILIWQQAETLHVVQEALAEIEAATQVAALDAEEAVNEEEGLGPRAQNNGLGEQ